MRLSKYYPLPTSKKDVMIKIESNLLFMENKFE